jgi:hypothetical protein
MKSARLLLSFLLFGGAIGTTGAASAGDGDAAPPARTDVAPKTPSTADLAKAKSVFISGGRAFDAGKYDTALQLFEQAYALAQRDSIVLAMGQTHRKLYTGTNDIGHLDKAEALLTRYLASAKAGPPKVEAQKLLEEVQLLRATRPQNASATPGVTPAATTRTGLYLDSEVENLVLRVDGGPPQSPPVDIEAAPGKHTVKASAPGFRDKEVSVLVVPSQVEPLTIVLDPLPGELVLDGAEGGDVYVDGSFVGAYPMPAGISVAPGDHFISVSRAGATSFGQRISIGRGEKKRVDVDLGATTQRGLSYAIITTGAIGLTAAGVFFGAALVNESAASDIDDRRLRQSITPEDLDRYDRARARRDDFASVGTGFAIGGGAVLLLGLGMFVFDREAPVPLPAAPGDRRAPEGTPERDVDLSFTPIVVPFGEERAAALRATLTF